MCPYFIFFRKSTFFQLGKDEFAVNRNFKSSSVRGHDDELGDVLLVLFQQRFRQTDGLGDVTSAGAVFQLYLFGHGSPSSRCGFELDWCGIVVGAGSISKGILGVVCCQRSFEALNYLVLTI